ncbi:MAG: RNA polymerase sigma factor [Bacteroidota bacterium]
MNTHADIIEACKTGDRQAQFRLYQLYSKAMFNICSRMLGNTSLAEDALQEAFISAFSKLHTYQGRASFGAWLKRIVINKCLSTIKKNRIQYESLEDHQYHIEDLVEELPKRESKIDPRKVHQAIKELPDGCRVIFTLYQMEGYDHKEISSILGITESTAKSQYHRAKKLLRKKLAN